MSSFIVKELERLEKEIQELSIQIVTAEKTQDPNIINLRIEFHKKKIEINELIKSAKDGEGHKFSTLKEAIIKLKSMPKKPKYETGIKVIDNYFDGGLELSQLVLIGGEKGSGKTAFSLQYLINVANGYKSAFFSFEMPEWKMAQRLLLKNPSQQQTKNFYIIEKGRDISQIEVSIKTLVKKNGVKFISIDSLMKITNNSIKESQHIKVSDITNRLSRLCIELDIIIVLIVQVTKEDLRSGHMAVKGSGDADYDADIMFFLKKDKDVPTKRVFICEKNRQNGNEFKQEVYFNPKNVSLQEMKPALYETSYTSSLNDTPTVSMEVI